MLKKSLNQDEIRLLSSTYLTEGRKCESWEILSVTVENDVLQARLRMRSTFVSPTDTQGFHLTIFSTLEFLSQLTIIYAHVWAGHTEKTREGWMVDSNITSRQAIRDPENIQVHMKVTAMKKFRDNLLAVTESRVFDDHGGLFIAKLKGFLS